MSYKPNPLDTTDIELPKELNDLASTLARNTHEVWASHRMQEGWKIGPKRDDELRTHPCLVPYETLSQEEQNYDLNTSQETLKLILSMGFKIIPPQEDIVISNLQIGKADERFVQEILHKIESAKTIDELKHLTLARQNSAWKHHPSLYIAAGEKSIRLGEPLIGYDLISEGLSLFPNDEKLPFLLGLSASRIGIFGAARDIIEEVQKRRPLNEDELSCLGKTYKELWSKSLGKDRFSIKKSYHYYHQAYLEKKGIYSGINSATVALLQGDEKQSNIIAQEVLQLCQKSQIKDYWVLATQAEAYLLLDQLEMAFICYTQAIEGNPDNTGDFVTTKNNINLILMKKKVAESFSSKLDELFKIPDVLIFTGHRVDSKNSRAPARLPEKLLAQVDQHIHEYLKHNKNIITYSSAACGSDILFLEAAQSLGIQTNIVLPGPILTFKENSVVKNTDELWGKRFDDVIKNAHDIILLGRDEKELRDVSYDFAGQIIIGLGRMRSVQLKSKLRGLAVLKEGTNKLLSGARALCHELKTQGTPFDVISIDQLQGGKFKSNTANKKAFSNKPLKNRRIDNDSKIMALFFADAVNFSKLQNELYPLFESSFWGLANNILRDFKVVVKNTWGDALHLVFPEIEQAGLFSLKLTEEIEKYNWPKLGLPSDLNLRIALHAGPVFESKSPITKTRTFVGSNVCRAARIEPMTPPGQVFASQEFAALVAAKNIKTFHCTYVGQMAMAKNYGIFPTYHLTRTHMAVSTKKNPKEKKH